MTILDVLRKAAEEMQESQEMNDLNELESGQVTLRETLVEDIEHTLDIGYYE